LKQRGSDEEVATSAMAGAEKTSSHVDVAAVLKRQTAIFHWEDVSFDIKIGKENRRILDHVDGWVKPGTLTALMVRTHPLSFGVSLTNLGCLWRW
jgi:ATP-binding cassette subfamily G (WHITE) protein 2 (PDR)